VLVNCAPKWLVPFGVLFEVVIGVGVGITMVMFVGVTWLFVSSAVDWLKRLGCR
jgi:hypothetical protein